MGNFTQIIQDAIRQYKQQLFVDDTDLLSVQISKIGNGENNHMFRVAVGEKVFVFRIPYRQELFPKLKSEFNVLQAIPTDIGPAPLVIHEGDETYMIQTLVAGQHVSTWTEKLLHSHVEQMLRLHRSHSMAAHGIDIVKLFEEKIDFRKVHDPEVLADAEIGKAVESLLSEIKKIQGSFRDVQYLSLIHGDLHNGNILVDEDIVRYVDWEESRLGDPALDVAGILLSPGLHIDADAYVALYQKSAVDDELLMLRVWAWVLYKNLSLLLHKKWESLDPQTRAIQQGGENYQAVLGQILSRINEGAGKLKIYSR